MDEARIREEGYEAGVAAERERIGKLAQEQVEFWKRAEAAAPNRGSVEACQHAMSAFIKFRSEVVESGRVKRPRSRKGRPAPELPTCGYCRYEEADGELIERGPKCRSASRKRAAEPKP